MGDGGGVFRINVTFPNWDPPNAKEKEQDNSTSLCDQLSAAWFYQFTVGDILILTPELSHTLK